MKHIFSTMLDELVLKARDSARKRMNLNMHAEPGDPVQRFCNAIEPGTYVRPHRHVDPATCETFVMLRGSAVLLFFDDSGCVSDRAVLAARGPVIAAEIPAGTWHAIAALEQGTIFFEVKQGPYKPLAEANSASWAPAEGGPGASSLAQWYATAQAGSRWSGA